MSLMEFVHNSSQSLIGRRQAWKSLKTGFDSQTAEFIAVYGRRRVGKTFLLQKFVESEVEKNTCVVFFLNGNLRETASNQLSRFYYEICQIFNHQMEFSTKPKNWLQVFDLLDQQIQAYTKKHRHKKVVIVFDELQWLEKPHSNFLVSLANIWNKKWFITTNIKLIICGSSASFLKKRILYTKGEFHRRVTRHIRLQPFSLQETQHFLKTRGFEYYSMAEIVELYMCLGGIPYYLNILEKRLSVHQNIHQIFFGPHAILVNELEALFNTLSSGSSHSFKIMTALNSKPYGISNKTLGKKLKLHKSLLSQRLK